MKYKNALVVGRFNIFHKGHESIIEKALEHSENVFIFIGSAQESGTERNPLPVQLRKSIIESIYETNSRVKIYTMNDLTHENDITHDWGRYVLDTVKEKANITPDVMVYGNDESRNNWFSDEDKTDVIILDRGNINISATIVRAFVKNNEYENFCNNTNEKIWKYYNELKLYIK